MSCDFCSQYQAFLNLKSWQLLYSWPKKNPQHCTSLHSLVIFQHCALDTGWKLSYQFDNGVVMSLPEQKTVSIITCRFSIPSWKKSRIYQPKDVGTHGTGDTLSDVDPGQVLPISMQTKNSFLPTTLWCSVF